MDGGQQSGAGREDPQAEAAEAAGRGIHPRDVRIARDRVIERHWMGGDPYMTALFNSLSVVFPRGEAFFIDTLRGWRASVPPKLAEDIRGFIQQEIGHSREHIALNRALAAAGYDFSGLERRVETVLDGIRARGDMFRLEATMCLEHITAIVSAELLANHERMEGVDPEFARLWLWHALEEVEHKHVAFDTWMHATRHWPRALRWGRRSASMLILSIGFLHKRIVGMLDLLRQDGITGMTAWRGVAGSLIGRKGVLRAIGKAWLDFFRPGFHPWQHDDHHLIAEAEARLSYADTARKALGLGEVELTLAPVGQGAEAA